MSSPRQLTKTVAKTTEPDHYVPEDDEASLGLISDNVQQSSDLHGKKVQTARKSFPKARKSFSNPSRAPTNSTVNRSDTAGPTTHNKEKHQIDLHPPGKEAEIIKLPPEISLVRSSPTKRDMSTHAIQELNHKSILATMRKNFNQETTTNIKSISTNCVPSSTTEPEAGDDFSEEELVPLKDKLSDTPQKTSFSGAEKIAATSTSKIDGVQFSCDTTPVPTFPDSPKPSDEKKVNVPDVHSEAHHPPTPAPTPFKEEDNVEAAMAALHGEPIEELLGITSTRFEVKQSPDSKSKVRSNQPEAKSTIAAESLVKQDITEEAVLKRRLEGSKPCPVKKAVDPSASYPMFAPEAPSDTKVDQIEKIEAKEATTTTAGKGGRRIRPVSRELESLYGDEGAANILREMEAKPHSKRRATMASKGATYASSIDFSSSPSPRRRSDRTRQESESERRKKKSKVQIPVAQAQTQQDDALQFWEAVPSSANKKKVVYAPRAVPPPSSGPKHGSHKRSSSESDLGASPVSRKKRPEVVATGLHRPNGHTIKSSDVSRLESDITSHLSEPTKESDFKEILLTYKDKLLHVTISPVSTTLHNSFNVPVLRELTALLKTLKTDTKVKVVLITSAGSDFCKGVDLPSIIHKDSRSREAVAAETVTCIRDFFIELASCEKILVGGLHGRVVGIGVAMLPYFDITYASEKAIFCLPYGILGQTTEGGLKYASRVTSKGTQAVSLMLYEGCKLTAEQAHQMGLIDSVLGLSSFHEALMPRVSAIASTASDTTLVNKRIGSFSQDSPPSIWQGLASILELESEELQKVWRTDGFVKMAEQFLDQDIMA